MRRFFISIIALCAISTVSAQWLDALKQVATEVIDQATDGKLTELAIVGSWTYTTPAVRFNSDNALANIGSSAIIAPVTGKMDKIFTKVGITEGFCSITFNQDGTFTMPIKGKTISGTYTYNNSDHSLTMAIGQSGKLTLKGYAYISSTNLQLLFNADKLADFIVNIASNIRSLSTITDMIKQYENFYLGFEFAK